MKTKSLCPIVALLLISPLLRSADDLKYPINEIPDSLMFNAKAVLRNSLEVFEIRSDGHGTYSMTYAITVLNENGLDKALWFQAYSQKFQRVNSIKGSIYDASGKKVENLTQDKVIDQSMISGYSLYEDSRVKYFVPKTMTYPFTAEYSYNVEFDGILNIPRWSPVKEYNVSVQKSTFKVIFPADKMVRYNANAWAGEPEIINENGKIIYKWETNNIPAFEDQPFSGSFDGFTPEVKVCPARFEIGGYAGDFSNWNDFGKWIHSLNAGRDILPEKTVQTVQDLVKDCQSDLEKARKIYEYMQSKTRYLNITVGIGGWQPIPAETVDRLGYGDCKALSNYTVALMKAAGLKANYSLVRAGDNVSEPSAAFPNNEFNHVIVWLPLSKDTLWLECTSQHVPFGYLGSFTDNRNALVIHETGASLIKTKSYSEKENQLVRSSSITIDINGNAVLSTSAVHNGILYDDKLRFYIAGTDDRKRMIHDEFNIPGSILLNVGYQEKHEIVPAIKETIEIEIPRYGTISGKRLLVSVLPVGRMREIPKRTDRRKSEVVIKRSVIATDSVLINLPPGYRPEAIPAEIKTESEFGSYSLKTQVMSDNQVLCVRKLITLKGEYPPYRYNELVDFYKKVALSDNLKISLIRQI